jgi:hypothetical protein
MPSFAGLYSPQLRLRIALSAIVLAAIVGSLLLAYAAVSIPQAMLRIQETASRSVPATIAQAPQSAVATAAVAGAGTEHARTLQLWTLLTPWALAVDAIAILGFALAMRMRRR